MTSLLSFIRNMQQQALLKNHRQLLRIQGEAAWCYKQAELLIDKLQQPYFWLGEYPATIQPNSAKQILGQETSLLFINALVLFRLCG